MSVLRLNNNALTGTDTLYALAKTNIRKQVGGSLLTTILLLRRTLVPTIACGAGVILANEW